MTAAIVSCKQAKVGRDGATAGWSSQHSSNIPADAHAYARDRICTAPGAAGERPFHLAAEDSTLAELCCSSRACASRSRVKFVSLVLAQLVSEVIPDIGRSADGSIFSPVPHTANSTH